MQVVLIRLTGIKCSVNAVEARGELSGHGEIRVSRTVDRPVLHPAGFGYPEHLGSVVAAIGRVSRSPGGPGLGRADAHALIRVDRRASYPGERATVVDQPSDVLVAKLRHPEPARVGWVSEQLRSGRGVPQTGMQVQSGTCEVRERLRHERGGQTGLVGDRLHHV